MEQIKWFLVIAFASLKILCDLYILVGAYKTGKISVYSTSDIGPFFGAKPIREHSLAFEPTYFWLEVLYRVVWPIAFPVVIYLFFFR